VIGAQPSTPPVLEACGLALAAPGRVLLENFTQTFAAGERWCVAGPNGAGKTTLITALAGLGTPARGQVRLDGIPIEAWGPRALARRRALLPQELHDAFSASVLEIVLLNRFAHLSGWGWEADDDRAAALAALDRLGLSALAARDVRSLSGGERRRVSLAAVLCQDAPLLLLDEPLAHLDWHRQIACLEALVAWSEEAPRIVVFSCHDLNLARRYATHALLLDGAGGAAAGPAREVLTPERASAAFGSELVLIARDGYEAVVPALPPIPHGSGPGRAKDT